MILPNLIPTQGPIDFKASYDRSVDVLHIAFRDPASWCQTHSIALKCKSAQVATRWLYKGLGANFDADGLTQLLCGGSSSGTADGNYVVPMTLVLAGEIILTEDIYTIWFTGAYAPYETRQYSLEVLLHKQPMKATGDLLLSALAKSFASVTFPANSPTEKTLIEGEYLLTLGNPNSRRVAVSRLAELFVLDDLSLEKAIVSQLIALRDALIISVEEIAESPKQFPNHQD